MGWTRTAALPVAAVLLVGAGGLVATQARAATAQVGNDISWPQCAAPAGYGNPMPADGTGFVVLGLTQGLPFTQNPCLADQARWIRDRALPFQAYTMAAYPTDGDLATYGGAVTDDLAVRLRRVGVAQARYAIASLQRIGLKPATVWIDVEKRNGQPWPTGTDKVAGNQAVIDGVAQGLKDAGFEPGIYSNADGWTTITGDWQRPDLPFWGTVGTRGQAAAVARCAAKGLNGGPQRIVQWWTTSPAVDYDVTCGTFTVPDPTATLNWPTASPTSGWSPSGSTALSVTAGPSRRQAWSFTVANSCTGATVRSQSGTTSDLIRVGWDGSRDDGAPAPSGIYRATLRTGVSAANGPSAGYTHEVVTYGATRVSGCRSTRVTGADVYGTAVELGKASFGSATTVVLASGDPAHLVDGVTAAPYARSLRAPLLLTAVDTLPDVVRADLQRRGARTVVIVGGTSAVSDQVVLQLRGLGITVTRIAGVDRYATAAQLAVKIGGVKKEILVASGTSPADVLLANGPAAGLGLPVLLVTPTSVPAATSSALKALGSTKATITVVGPTAAVSSGVQATLRAKAKSLRRLGSTDRAAQAATIASTYATRLGSPATVTVVNALSQVSMLAAGQLGRAVLLTGTTALPAPTATWLRRYPGARVTVVGLPTQVAPGVVVAIGK